jgi:hypothetical protein
MVVTGASYMLQSVLYLNNTDEYILDLVKKGWFATKSNVNAISEQLRQVQVTDHNYTIVLDPVSNFVYRYKQCDESFLLRYRTNSGYHMGGGGVKLR